MEIDEVHGSPLFRGTIQGSAEAMLFNAARRSPMETKDLLAERGKTHGDYAIHAAVTQHIKRAMHHYPGWDRLADVHKEALEMIAHKIGRIIAGNPNHKDHWDDIAGYAKLVSDRL